MTITSFIEKAIEGGWNPFSNVGDAEADECMSFYHEILLDPLAWKAVGKVVGWSQSHRHYENNERKRGSRYRYEMHRMIDALVDGKTIEEFLATL